MSDCGYEISLGEYKNGLKLYCGDSCTTLWVQQKNSKSHTLNEWIVWCVNYKQWNYLQNKMNRHDYNYYEPTKK